MRSQEVELHVLKIGSKFEVVGLEDCFRNLILLTVTDSCSTIKGESSLDDKNEDGKRIWKNLGVGHTMSNRTVVRRL